MTPTLCAENKQEIKNKILPQRAYVAGTKGLLVSWLERNKLGKKVREEKLQWDLGTHQRGPTSRGSPILLLLVEVGHDGQQAADEGLTAALLVRLRGQKSTSLLGLCQFPLQLDILLSEKQQVLLQLGHLLCEGNKESSLPRQV